MRRVTEISKRSGRCSKNSPDSVSSRDDNGNTPLHWAAANGHKEVTELLLANKADVNAKNNDGATPLYAAAGTGHQDVVELLLANKADSNARTNRGMEAWRVAALAGHREIATFLLASNADVDAENNPSDAASRADEVEAKGGHPKELEGNWIGLDSTSGTDWVFRLKSDGTSLVIEVTSDGSVLYQQGLWRVSDGVRYTMTQTASTNRLGTN